jgi:DNA-binding CsgD family transcriptional regulator
MGLVAIGKTNYEIASILGIAIKTVEKYMTVLYIKTDVRNRVELVLWHLAAATR